MDSQTAEHLAVKSPSVSFSGAATLSVRASIGTNLAGQLLYAADLFMRQAEVIERDSTTATIQIGHPDFDRIHREHQAYITGSILTVVAFLDATINHVYSDAANAGYASNNYKNSIVEHVAPDVQALLAATWKHANVENSSSVLPKYNLALELAKQKRLAGENVYENVDCVVRLRHRLTHHKPSLSTPSDDSEVWAENKEERKIEETLLKKRVPLNTLGGVNIPGGPILAGFPGRFLSGGCARWAITNSAGFVDEFCRRMGITSYLAEQLVMLA